MSVSGTPKRPAPIAENYYSGRELKRLPTRWHLLPWKLLDQPANTITALATFTLVIYTAYLANYAAQQTQMQNEQLDKVNKALAQTGVLIKDANSQARSSETQAQEAIKSNKQNTLNSVVQLRPYVSVGKLVYDINSSLIPSAVELKNGSQTPALSFIFRTRMMLTTLDKVNAVIRSGLDNGDEVAEGDTAQLVGAGDTTQGILNPDTLGEDLKFISLDKFSDSDMTSYRSGKRILWISGIVFYKDVFLRP